MRSHREHVRAIALLGIPIIIGQLGTIIQGWADTMMVGNYGTAELSASGFVNNVYNLAFFLLLGISYATTPVTGGYYGRKDWAGVTRSLRESIVVNLMVSAIVIGALAFLYRHIEWLGQPQELLPIIRPYYLTLLASMPALALFNAIKQHLDALGQTRLPMYIMLASNVVNVVLNALLIYGLAGMPRWGLLGAGVATLIARCWMLLAIWWVIAHIQQKTPDKNSPKAKVSKIGCIHLLRIGLPISAQLFLEAASFSICAIFMGWLGKIPLAAHQLTATLSTMIFMVLYGIGAAAAIRVAQFRGRGEWNEIRRTALTAWGMNAVCCLILVSTICGAFSWWAHLFTSDEEVIATALTLSVPLVLYQIGDCTQITFANVLRGMECVQRMMLYALIAYGFISLPASYFLGFVLDLGPQGVWLGTPFGLTSAALMFLYEYRKNINKHSSSC